MYFLCSFDEKRDNQGYNNTAAKIIGRMQFLKTFEEQYQKKNCEGRRKMLISKVKHVNSDCLGNST